MRLLIASIMRLLIDHFLLLIAYCLLLVHGMTLPPVISGTGQEIKGSLFMRISHQCEVMYIDR